MTADVTACLLGRDLWYSSLSEFRDWLKQRQERPHLWTFEFTQSQRWETATWESLSLGAKLLRSRAGPVQQRVTRSVTAYSCGLSARVFAAGLRELTRAGYYRAELGLYEAVATSDELRTDLALIEIISHWLVMLRHRERVLADRHATGFEVHGYPGGCSRCRECWGLRPFEPRWAPPFHPGCRCFAQPRFTTPSSRGG